MPSTNQIRKRQGYRGNRKACVKTTAPAVAQVTALQTKTTEAKQAREGKGKLNQLIDLLHLLRQAKLCVCPQLHLQRYPSRLSIKRDRVNE